MTHPAMFGNRQPPNQLMIKHVIAYGVSNITARAASFVLLPLYAMYLTPEDFGTATLLWTIIAGGTAIALGNLDSAMLRFKDEQDSIVIIAAIASFTIVVIGTGLYVLSSTSIIALSITVIISCDSLSAVLLNGLRSVEDSKGYFINRIFYTLVLIGTTVFFIKQYGNILAVFTAQLCASALSIIQLRFRYNIHTAIIINIEKIKKYLRYSLPVAVTVLLFIALDFLDRWFIELYTTRADVGFYGAIYRLGMIVSVIVTASQLAWTPFALKHHDKPETLGKWQIYANFAYAIACLVTVFVLPVAITKFKLLPEAYQAYFNLLIPVALSYWIFGVGQAQAASLLHHKKTEWATLSAGLAVVVNIGLNILLIPDQGLVGAANATLAAYAVYTISIFVLSYKISIIRYNWQLLAALWAVTGYLLWLA